MTRVGVVSSGPVTVVRVNRSGLSTMEKVESSSLLTRVKRKKEVK